MRKAVIFVAVLALAVAPVVIAKGPHGANGNHGGANAPSSHLTTYVLNGTLSHYAAMSGTTKGTITVLVQTSHPQTFLGQTLTFAVDTTTTVSLPGGMAITDGQYGTVIVSAPHDATAATLQTYVPLRISLATAPHYPTVQYVFRGTVTRFVAATASVKGQIALQVRSANFDSAAFRGTNLTFTVGTTTSIVLHEGKPVATGDHALVKLAAAKHSTAAQLQTQVVRQIVDQGSGL